MHCKGQFTYLIYCDKYKVVEYYGGVLGYLTCCSILNMDRNVPEDTGSCTPVRWNAENSQRQQQQMACVSVSCISLAGVTYQ